MVILFASISYYDGCWLADDILYFFVNADCTAVCGLNAAVLRGNADRPTAFAEDTDNTVFSRCFV